MNVKYLRVLYLFGLINRALQLFKRNEKSAELSPVPTFHDLIEDAWYGSIHVNATKAFSPYRKSSAISTAVDLVASKIETITPVIDRGGEIQDGRLCRFGR